MTNGQTGTANRIRVAAWGGAAMLVLLPLVAMRFTQEVHWTPADFAFAVAMLGGVGIAFELAVRASGRVAYRVAAGLALLAAFLLVWINLAVGIIGSEDNPANLMFAGVIAVAVAGTMAARARPAGMASAMGAAATAQVAVGVVALVAGYGFIGPVTAMFTALWAGSARLFARAARQG